MIVISLVFLVVHRALEGIVCDTDRGDPARRRFLWNMGTAAFFLLALGALVFLTFLNVAWRQSFGPIVLFGAPVALVGISVFAYANYLVYTRDGIEPPARETPEHRTT